MKFEWFNEGPRIQSLDGIRAIAISIVIAAHASGTLPFAHRKDIYRFTGDLGPLGVSLFFVLSGFLITNVLFRDAAEQKRVDLRRFYIRRAFRIFPAYVAFLTAMGVLQIVGVLEIPGSDWLGALTYTINYHLPRNWYLTHTWSLSVEEQFYLLWPAAIWLWGRNGALWGAAVIVAVVPFIRAATVIFVPEHRNAIPWEFHTVCDSLAIGCLLAGVHTRLGHISWLKRPVFAPIASGGALFITALQFHQPVLRYSIGPTLVSLFWAWLIYVSVTTEGKLLGRFLNSPAATYIGLISYSLYLWQQPFLQKHDHWILGFPLNVLWAFLAAVLSYHCIEKPCLRLRTRLTGTRSPKASGEASKHVAL